MRKCYGVGINDLGWSSFKRDGMYIHGEYRAHVYDCWHHMLERCYDLSSNLSYNGNQVCDRWLRLSNFERDIHDLVGYVQWKYRIGGRWDLDKDIRCGHSTVYDKEHCMFVTCSMNAMESNHRNANVRITAAANASIREVEIVENGNKLSFNGAYQVAEYYGVSRQTVSDWLCGRNRGYLLHGVSYIAYVG